MATHIDTPPNQSWVQVTDEALNCSPSTTVMVRTYKLPTSVCRNILNYITLGMTPAIVEARIVSNVGALDDGGVTGSNFIPQDEKSFGLNSYQLQQIEAGQYMLLKCRYEYIGIDIDGLDPDVPFEQEVSQSWQVSWTTYSVSPYIYCDEIDHSDQRVGVDEPEEGDGHAKRSHIEWTEKQPSKQTSNNPDGVYMRLGSMIPYKLTGAEQKIKAKVDTGVNPVFHKPIVSCHRIWKTNQEDNLPDPQGDIDKEGWPGGAEAQGWEGSFIYCGMSYTKTSQEITVPDPRNPGSTKTVTIYTIDAVDTWEGARKLDPDFYGTNAWKFGQGPSPAPENSAPALEPNNGGENNG